ncbi:type II toxin-antitoxin system HicB family antitoxin [Thermodesulfobacteriota bacterium]
MEDINYGEMKGKFKMTKLTLEYWEDDGWFVGRIVEVPNIFSQGETLEELKENIQDAYKLMLDSEPQNLLPASRNRVAVELVP